MDESDYRASSARTLHSLTALSGEVGGLRGDLRLDVDRLSSRLLAKVGLIGTERRCLFKIASIAERFKKYASERRGGYVIVRTSAYRNISCFGYRLVRC